MDLRQLPERSQDYLKILWAHEERHGLHTPMALSDLAAAAGQKVPTASEAVKRLTAKDLVSHEKYAGVHLTDLGRTLAVKVVRRHRLVETLLVETLNYSWDEVHEEAEILEHAVSDRFIERVDALLSHPVRDPHGDPIPHDDGSVEPLSSTRLSSVGVGDRVVVEQVSDADPELLRYLDAHGIHPGTTLSLVEAPVAGLLKVSSGREVIPLSLAAAGEIAVRRLS